MPSKISISIIWQASIQDGANRTRTLHCGFAVAPLLAPPIAILRKTASRAVGGATRVFPPQHESAEGVQAAMATKLYRMLPHPRLSRVYPARLS
jgi:hypothetical protein